MRKKKLKNIDFNYNLKVYWSFLKKYKAILFIALGLVLLLEASYTVEKYLLKLIIDNGTDFVNGVVLLSDFRTILLIVAAVFLFIMPFFYMDRSWGELFIQPFKRTHHHCIKRISLPDSSNHS